MLILEDGRSVCYVNGQRSQFTCRFLSTTAKRNRDEKPFLCRPRFVDLSVLNYSKEKSGVSVIIIPAWLRSIIS